MTSLIVMFRMLRNACRRLGSRRITDTHRRITPDQARLLCDHKMHNG